MDEELLDESTIPLSRYTRVPGKGFFYPDSRDDERAETRAAETIEGSEAIVIADGDADGLACAAMIRETYGAALDVSPFEAAIVDRLGRTETSTGDTDVSSTSERGDDVGAGGGDENGGDGLGDGGLGDDGKGNDADGDDVQTDADGDRSDPTENAHAESSVGLLDAGPYSLDTALERVGTYADDGIELFVCDLCPDEYQRIEAQLEALADSCSSIRWFDHHQWDDSVAEAVRGAGVDLVVGDSDTECTADVTLRSLEFPFDERWADLAAVTRDHDLWIKDDPRSDDISDYAYWTSAEEYVAVVGAYGADLPSAALEYVEQRRIEKRARIDAAVDRAVVHDIADWAVAVTYGRCSQNEVAERLRRDGADAAVIVKPAGSASIRGSEGFEHAHEVAGKVNGGGHPRAAGCKPDIYDDMLDYAHHWTTEGQACRRVILAAFEAVAAELSADA